ncbi:MAG: YbcC family protein [Bosea sp. (in: a-proteobacteria)]
MTATATAQAALADPMLHADRAARIIPPLWPLSASVAVNPFLGLCGETLAQAAARLGRAGVPVTMPRSFYRARWRDGEISRADLADALAESQSSLGLAELEAALAVDPAPAAALPSVAALCAETTGFDWPGFVTDRIGAWASGHFDLGQAMWPKTAASGAYESWRAFATHDLSPEIAGLKSFCLRVAREPQAAPAAIRRACLALGLPDGACESYFTTLLVELGGWAQYARQLQWQAERDGAAEHGVIDLLAIRLSFEAALHAQFGRELADPWRQALAAHAAPVQPSVDQTVDALLQEAYDRAAQRRLLEEWRSACGALDAPQTRPTVQAVFCIDTRSEIIRRALESLDPGLETLGFAGFFGVGVSHRRLGSIAAEARLPVLLKPGLSSIACDNPFDASQDRRRIGARASRAWGRFKRAAVSSFAFVEASGPLYLWKLLSDALSADRRSAADQAAPRLSTALTLTARVEMAAAILRAMSLTGRFARLVLVVGHGARLVNNAHGSALQCGACGGFPGDVNARLLASLLNDAEVRAALPAQGLVIPDDTHFLAGLHDTVSDEIALFDREAAPAAHRADLARLEPLLLKAGALARTERALSLPGAASERDVAARGRNWAEIRPEWGLAGCRAFIAAPRQRTAGARLAGRAFLHSYDWRADGAFKTLELILTAPVVVASWISLQYYGSAVAPAAFGAGNKLLHNVVGGMGVFEGNGGVLRGGLPWQSVHDGERLVHEPLRLSVIVAAPREAILAVLTLHPQLRALFDQGWLALFAMDDAGAVAWRYCPGAGWVAVPPAAATERRAA